MRIVASLVLAVSLFLPMLGPSGGWSASVAKASTDVEKIDPELKALMAAEPLRLLPVIVEMSPLAPPFLAYANALQAQRGLALLTRYGRPVGGLGLIGSAAGFANAAGITSISLDSGVAFVHSDSTVHPSSIVGPPVPLSAPYPRAVNADQVWQLGPTGAGVTLAVLDSGVNPDGDLTRPNNRLLASVNFAGPRGELPDAGGHGTHIAGIAAGNGYDSGGEYVGVAPGANVVDVRVLDRKGNGRISSVVRGIEWVLAHRAQYNIRLINLSLGMPARTSYRLDPLCAAAEIAWLRGVAVVAAAGNGGPNSGSVDSPGTDPYVITVGATDDAGTFPVGDDILSSFSAWGTQPGSTPKPDVVAPGRRIVSLRAPGSYLDTHYPERITLAHNGSTYFRLSGTSMATAVTTGAAGLLLQNRPKLSPANVKSILANTTQRYGWAAAGIPRPDPAADGRGLVDALAAAYSGAPAPANAGLRPADMLARSLYSILYGSPLTWKNQSYQGIDWTRLSWGNLAWDNLAWDNLAWDNLAWDNLAWDNLAWDNLAWDNLAWDAKLD